MALEPPFANVTDLEERWRPLSAEEQPRAETLLTDASYQILAEDRHGRLDSLTVPTNPVVRVTCDMARRAMQAPVDTQPVSQEGATWGPFSEQRTYSNPGGDMYITKAEKRLLGLNRQRARSVAMWQEPQP